MRKLGFITKILPGFFLLSFGILASSNAMAAPQILGLVASTEPTKIQCHEGICFAEFSAYCLQEHRKVPDTGTAYLPSKMTKVSLHVAGKTVPVATQAKFVSMRGYTSVQISLPEKLVKSYTPGATESEIALSVGPSASLVPVAIEGDSNPQSAEEIALYTGSHRDYAERVSNNKNKFVESARLTSRLINALPKYQDATPEMRAKLWVNEIDQRARDVAFPAYQHAKEAFNTCKLDFNMHGTDGMRQCLEIYHDEAMTDVTQKVWKELKPGG